MPLYLNVTFKYRGIFYELEIKSQNQNPDAAPAEFGFGYSR